ncbi:CaiB/BaiF CoA transferase family protein [Nocardia aurantia]|uniref:Cinnamoyl-CoA:phenyllactate CoA-transferase n=1 Tax=Nocardia aurantia TaxID=2585199 RepID=A0A7K0DU83_9NOCA|nr:CoA transferase [Nocardia aurantia]MQY29323.1 Cinnamoyl-CoA:phenyllactate CoA-transferase [Nocardia aurantia]
MTEVMQGVRILEVAEHTFVPAASALLADWGAEVIKIEHVERGDAMRGLGATGVVNIPSDVHVLLEHSNRGKKSLGLDLNSDEGRAILYRLAATADVFLTNKLPRVRQKLQIDVDTIREHNPNIIYVRGTGQGDKGPEADAGSYDSLAFWARPGVGMAMAQPSYGHVPSPPAPGFGDSIGGMTIAGGIMGALFHRERTGEATTVDVSLLGTGIWAMGQAVALSLLMDVPWMPPPEGRARLNPLVGNYLTQDGRWLSLCCLQAGRYWAEACELIGRPDLATDPRFADHAGLQQNCTEAVEILNEVFASRPLDEWRTALAGFSGQWTVVQTTLELPSDPQVVANGYVQECRTASGTPFRMAAAPVQYGEQPPVPGRAPEFNEHGDAILADLGLDWDTVVDLKVRGIVA